MSTKSAAALTIAAPEFDRPEPPTGLPERESALWRSVVATKPADWFTRDIHALLLAYCRGVICAEDIAVHVQAFNVATLKSAKGLTRYDKLMKMQERQARVIASLATKMRLTQQSRYTAGSAATKARGSPATPPWEQQKAAPR